MLVYCARQITGCSYDEVVDYYEDTRDILQDMGYEVFVALCGKSYLRNEREFAATGYKQPLSTDHAIFQRDWWMCRKCDILLVNLLGATTVSIGTVMEMAWAADHGKHVILVMEENNIHNHAFVKEAASVVYNKFEDALDYLKKLIRMELLHVHKDHLSCMLLPK